MAASRKPPQSHIQDEGPKTRIIRHAVKLFSEKGYHGTSIDDIARSTGLSKGAFYWHFKSKFELFRAVLDRQLDNIREILLPRKEDLRDKDLKQFFLERGEKLIDFHLSKRENVLLWLHISLEAQRGNTEVAGLAKEIVDSVTNELIETITEVGPFFNEMGDLDLRELILLFEDIFKGLLLDLHFMREPDLSKKFWTYLVKRIMPGVENNAAKA